MENILIPESNISLEPNIETNLTPLNPKKIKIYIIVIVFFITIITLLLSFFIQKTKLSKTNYEDTSTGKNTEAQSGLTKYRNDILGIEFQYPETWGEMTILPSENITHLQTINKDFLNNTDNDLRYMVKLGFSKNSWISLNFINDLYPGKKYPNGDAFQYGPMDNFQTLKTSQNICNYHFNFQNKVYENNVNFSERDDKCEDDIKTTLFFENPDSTNSSGEKYYNYKIEQYFFKKLTNNFFDNLLIENFISFSQNEDSNLTFNQVLQKENEVDYFNTSSSEFKQFVKSIKVFNPPTPTPLIFSQNSKEDPNITTIRHYYFYLATQKLTDAYDMYLNKNISFDEFTKWYGQVFNTNVYNIKQNNPNIYTFNVDLSEKNLPIAKYKVTMEINNNKINTLSSEEIFGKEAKFSNLIAYSRLKSNKNEMVLIKDGNEIVIESADNDWENKIETTKTFSNPKFSSQGNYLTYKIGGWEYSGNNIYDIKNNKFIDDQNSSFTSIYEISKDEKYLINCGESRFAGDIKASIFSFPDLKLKFNFLDGIEDDVDHSFDCFYDNSKNIVKFILTDTKQDNAVIKTIIYNLDTQKVVQ
ncbi:MAG: hypothetical protein PHN66_01605 [Candidatus Shapirobacteria bacterium]|nr:hypothetical protein [Candidatus Shapirobacteria bacterium]